MAEIMLKEYSSSTKLGPHMVRFLSVLAISGSVAFISFMGKAKLLRPRRGQDKWTTHSQLDLHLHGDFEEEEEEEEEDEEEAAALTHSQGDYEEQKEQEEESHTLSQGDYEDQKLHTLSISCQENEHSPTHLKSLHEGNEPTTAPLKRTKRVRFASDVVDPPCNGQQYRSKWRVLQGCEKHEPPCNDQVLEPSLNHHQHYKSKRRVSRRFGADEAACNGNIDVPSINDQQYKSTHNVSQGYITHAHLAHPKMPSKSCKASQGCEVHALFSHPQVPSKSPPSIPANRLALYKGLRQSRLQHSLHCL